MNSSPVMALTWYSAVTMEIWEAMDFGGGLGEVELLYPAKTRSDLMGANCCEVEDRDE